MWNWCGVVVFHGSMVKRRRGWGQSIIDPCYTIIPHKSAQGICALCYMWNWCGALVIHGSMVDWRRGCGQSVMKLIQCSGLPWIYGQLEGVVLASRSAKFGVVVFKASLLKWGGQSVIDACYTVTPSPCQSTIGLCYTVTPHESVQVSVPYAICETYVV